MLEASAANDATSAAVDAPNEQAPITDTPVTQAAEVSGVSAGPEEVNKPQETTQVDVVMVEQGQQEGEDTAENDSDEKDEALNASEVEEPAATEAAEPETPSVSIPQADATTELHADSANAATLEQTPAAPTTETKPALGGEQEPETGTSGDGDNVAHDESEYDPSAVPHGEDEYDPANPSPTGSNADASFATHQEEYNPANPSPTGSNADASFATHQEEYDPDHPSMSSATATEEPVTMDVDHPSPRGEQSTLTPAKRKADDEVNSSSNSAANEDKDSKRPRHVDDNKSSSHDGDRKQGRHRRGSGDSTSSSRSKDKHHEEDHKGLSDAAWDRLMDFQTSGEFRVTQVSRAAFASVGSMPEFAQITIIARFVRTPMKGVRDKNGQLMRIYREYQKENPQVAALQPVDAFISDYKSDPGLFRFGYAPPLPATGMSNVQVPYLREQPEDDTPAKNSPRPARAPAARSEPEQHRQKDVDEFGRAVHSDKAMAQETNGSARTSNQRSAVDPRLASRSRQDSPSTPTQAVPRVATGTRAEDPRRRDQPQPQSSSGAGRDPRRRGSQTNQQPSPRGSQPSRAVGSDDLYGRLPPPVKAVVDSMRREGRLQEPLNDNVVTRLLHLPERVALQAVENFSNVDLSQVENLQGFLVGIINRVNEKAIASEKQQRPQVPSPRGQPPSMLLRGGDYAAPPQGGSVLGGPPQGGRLNNTNGANVGGYHGQPAPMAAGPAPALYDRPYEASQDPRDPRRRQQPVPQGMPQYGAVRGPPPVPVGMPSFTALPMSVQNHVHSLVANRTLASLEELGGKCYEVLGQLSEPLANQVLSRFAGANLSDVRNKCGFLIGIVKRARQEYGFN